ncbi:MAG: DUF1284 domain-containing protein [Clostridia bacterium]|nr:DUF1284 domain-containing protein [Clostridia bacterium]
MQIRPHHLLCMGSFVGKGYSDEFTENMCRVITALENGENIILVNGADDICRACPFNNNGICKDKEKVDRYDKAVMDALSLEYGGLYAYGDIGNEVINKICRKDKLSVICGDCEWSELCGRIYQNKLQKF